MSTHALRLPGAAAKPVSLLGAVTVVPSMALDEATGGKLNVNADTAATGVAVALGAEKMIYMSDVNGVRRDKQDPSSIIHSLTDGEAREMIKTGVVDAGMIPKVEACLATLDLGVHKVHIIDGRLRHSLLLEMYTTTGVGTEIVLSASRAVGDQRSAVSQDRIAVPTHSRTNG